MYTYSFKDWFSWPSLGEFVTYAVVATLMALVLIIIFVFARFFVSVFWQKRQLNEDDPQWLEYCHILDNKRQK